MKEPLNKPAEKYKGDKEQNELKLFTGAKIVIITALIPNVV